MIRVEQIGDCTLYLGDARTLAPTVWMGGGRIRPVQHHRAPRHRPDDLGTASSPSREIQRTACRAGRGSLATHFVIKPIAIERAPRAGLEANYRQARNLDDEREAANVRLWTERWVGELLKELARAEPRTDNLRRGTETPSVTPLDAREPSISEMARSRGPTPSGRAP